MLMRWLRWLIRLPMFVVLCILYAVAESQARRDRSGRETDTTGPLEL